jgi:hypothetical protein
VTLRAGTQAAPAALLATFGERQRAMKIATVDVQLDGRRVH